MSTSSGKVILSSTNVNDWVYVNEGGATIVFSYTGPPNRQFSGTVLRLRKTRSKHRAPGYKPKVHVSESSEDSQDEEEPDDGMIEFQHTVMERLVAEENLPRLESVGVTKLWLEAIAILRDVDRPLERRKKDHIDVTRTKAVLATDLVGGEGIAIEIKPKWGFMPSPVHLSSVSSTVKLQTCRFCMHSSLRAKKGDNASLEYCPLDLFSGDEARITKSIDGLWASWLQSKGDVNNLRIFVKGAMVKPVDESAALETVASALGTRLGEVKSIFTSTLVQTILNTRLFSTLASLERSLDSLDIEGLAELWRVSQPPQVSLAPPLGFGQSAPTITEWKSFLDDFLSSPVTPTANGLKTNVTPPQSHTNPEPESLRFYLLAYLLSATFKDCSIFIRPAVSDEEPRVTVIDLDPKGMDRLQKWEALDTEICEAYLQKDVGERKTCVDVYQIGL